MNAVLLRYVTKARQRVEIWSEITNASAGKVSEELTMSPLKAAARVILTKMYSY